MPSRSQTLASAIHPPCITHQTRTNKSTKIPEWFSDNVDIDIDHPTYDDLVPHGGRRGMGEVLVQTFGYRGTAQYLDNSEEMVRERYLHIKVDEFTVRNTANILQNCIYQS